MHPPVDEFGTVRLPSKSEIARLLIYTCSNSCSRHAAVLASQSERTTHPPQEGDLLVQTDIVKSSTA